MSELLPYENELANQLHNLPLPDENMAWADMKRRLDEDDDNIAPVWWRGCALWGLLGMILFVAGCWLVKHKIDASVKQAIETTDSINRQTAKMHNKIVSDISKEISSQINAPKKDSISVKTVLQGSLLVDTVSNTSKEKATGTKNNTISRKQQYQNTSLLKQTSQKTKVKASVPVVEDYTTTQPLKTGNTYAKKTGKKLFKPGHKKIRSSNADIESNINENTSNAPIENGSLQQAKAKANTTIYDTTAKPVEKTIKPADDTTHRNNGDTTQKKKGRYKKQYKRKEERQ